MANFRKILTILCLLICSTTAYSTPSWLVDKPIHANVPNETMTIKITVNSNSHTYMKDIPTKGHLEVYTILGRRIKRIDLKNCKDGASLELANGLYILRVGKVTQKIVVRQ